MGFAAQGEGKSEERGEEIVLFERGKRLESVNIFHLVRLIMKRILVKKRRAAVLCKYSCYIYAIFG